MRTAIGMGLAVLMQALAGAALAGSGDGLTLPSDRAAATWPRWQTRVAVNETPPRAAWRNGVDTSLSLQGAAVVGDFYFARATWIARTQGGFRATGGLFVGSRFDNATSTLPGPNGQSPNVVAATGRYALSGTAGSLDGLTATPYVGVGYTALSGRDGWGFSADLGLVSQGMRLGQSQAFRPGLDDNGLRDNNHLVSPLLRFGVSYSF
jgi:hypothetical protein